MFLFIIGIFTESVILLIVEIVKDNFNIFAYSDLFSNPDSNCVLIPVLFVRLQNK